MPVGGENIDAFDGDIRLAVADGGEYFVTYGSDKDEPALEGEVIYKDNTGAICRCWNWRESVRTMLEEDVTHAFMIIEQVNSDRHDEMEAALDELGQMVTAELGGTCTKYIANAQNPEIVIEE
jgi:DNA/RNA-binding domain of Phe-tRNA-synthetase-like protein